MTHKFLSPENVMPTGESFNFTALGLSQVYTADKVGEDMRITIRWVDADGFSHNDAFGVEDVRKHIENGSWEILPSTQTVEQSFEDAFAAVQGIVKSAKELNMENGSTIVFATGEDEAWESASGTILDSIKAFTQTTSSVVLVTEGIYEVYWQNETFYAKTDKQLVEVMKALETLEGCV